MDAFTLYRLGNWFYRHKIPLFPSLLQLMVLFLFNCYIPFQVKIGKGCQIGHRGIGVVIKAEHMCMTHRGVLEHESDMTTSIVRGKLRDVETIKREFFTLLQGMKGFTNGSK